MVQQAFTFKPSARLQRFLGKELIADPNLAVLEFVKNAYDAGAAKVIIDFHIADPQATMLFIADNGVGMDTGSFERNWMHPGYSAKATNMQSTDAHITSLSASERLTNRVPSGEKGLGRLAAGRLGERLEVYTRSSESTPWLHVTFDWSRFDDMSAALADIAIPYDEQTPPVDYGFKVGTIVQISNLNLKWNSLIRGRPATGRSRDRLGRLKEDLQLLIRPLEGLDQDFTIGLRSDAFAGEDATGDITPKAAVESADYSYSFEVSRSDTGLTVVHRFLRRSPRIQEEFSSPPVKEWDEVLYPRTVAGDKALDESLLCGAFTGAFLFTPPQAAKRAREIDAIGSGVLLYRDGILVEPYGLNGNDWVGVAARKAQRQGHALIQPNTLSGYILISRAGNPDLRDMSNRMGLLENDASEQFIQIVRREFLAFEQEINAELSQRWKDIEERASEEAQELYRATQMYLRAIAHSLGQPLMGLAADVVTSLNGIALQPSIGETTRAEIRLIAESARIHIETAQRILSRFLEEKNLLLGYVSVKALVDKALEEVRPVAIHKCVTLNVSDINSEKVLVSSDLVFEVLRELLVNAIDAPRPEGRLAEVRLSTKFLNGEAVIYIGDNASGIPNVRPDQGLETIPSTSGRPGHGLRYVATMISATRGLARIAATGPEGTLFEVRLPTLASGLRGHSSP